MLLIPFAFLALADTSPTASSGSDSGIAGVISIGPIQGGPSRQGGPDSRPLANTVFVVTKGDNTVASFTTDDQGRFRISLDPGHYSISRKDWKAAIGYFGPFEVDIAKGQIKKVQWSCDTGIR